MERYLYLQCEKAMARKTKKGRESEEFLLEIIRDYAGLSLYELAKKAKWTVGRVDGTVRRLLNSGEVFIKVIDRDGRRVNLVYPKEQKPSDIIEVPLSLLNTENPLWQREAFIYALDNANIGVSGREIPEWNEISCFSSKIPIEIVNGKISLKIPEKFVRFYHLNEKHRAVSVDGNSILITVSGDIIETKRYPA